MTNEEKLLRDNEALVIFTLAPLGALRREDAEDFIQEGRLALLRAIRMHDPAKGTLATVAIPRIRWGYFRRLKEERRRSRLKMISLDEPISDADGLTLAETIADPRANAERDAVDRIEIEECLSLIRSPRDRECLMLAVEGFSCRDIASSRGVSFQCVNQRINRALKQASGLKYRRPPRQFKQCQG